MLRALPRPTSFAPLLAVLLAVSAGSAVAQQQSASSSTQNQTPANVQSVAPGSDTPATNIPTRRGTQIDEYRENGQVTEVDVTAGGSHYSMKPNTPPGNAVPGSVTGNQIRAPQWTVGTFDLSGKRHANTDSGQNAPMTDAPPPPRLQGTDKQ